MNLRGLAGILERPHIDSQLEEALAEHGDLLYLATVFGPIEGTAIRYAVDARKLLDAFRALDSPETPVVKGHHERPGTPIRGENT